MTERASQVLKMLRELPLDEREQVFQEYDDALTEEEWRFHWSTEVRRRREEMLADPSVGIDAEEAHARLRARKAVP